MPINMTMAALLMSGAMHSAEPSTKLMLDTYTIAQANGGAPFVLAAAKRKESSPASTLPKQPLATAKPSGPPITRPPTPAISRVK
jgi:hypothetical protein